MKKRAIVATVALTEFDVELLLKVLGSAQNHAHDHGQPARPIEILMEKIYRAMGVRI